MADQEEFEAQISFVYHCNENDVLNESQTTSEEQYNSDDTALVVACTNGFVDVVKWIVYNTGAKINNNKDDVVTLGNTPLTAACRWGHLEIVQFLILTAEADVNAVDQWHSHSLLSACRFAHKSISQYLLLNCTDNKKYDSRENERFAEYLKRPRQIIDVDRQDLWGNTSLHYVIWCCKNNGVTSLHGACMCGDDKKVCNILFASNLSYESENCALNAQTNRGNTPLHLACKYRHKNIAALLIMVGADINIRNEPQKTPLGIAKKLNFFEFIPIFDSSLKIPTLNPQIALKTWSQAFFNTFYTQLLIEFWKPILALVTVARRGQINKLSSLASKCNDYQLRRALCLFIHRRPEIGAKKTTVAGVIDYLLNEKSVDANYSDHNYSPLTLACYMGRLDVVESFHNNRNCVINELSKKKTTVDKVGRTPLLSACSNAQFSVAKYIITKMVKIDINYCNEYGCSAFHQILSCEIKKGFTELHMRCQLGNAADMDDIYFSTRNVNARDAVGNTPLHVACRRGDSDIVRVLLQQRADLFLINDEGMIPIEVAMTYKYQQVVALLDDQLTKMHFASSEVNLQNTPKTSSATKKNHRQRKRK